jgi:hypothetical protein
LFEIQADDGQDRFSDHGDSGSVYFTFNEGGFLPFEIHRCSRSDGMYSYGCVLNESLKALGKTWEFKEVKFL